MYALSDIVDRIELKTGNDCAIIEHEQPRLVDFNVLPAFFVGYASEEPADAVSAFNERAIEGFSGYDEITKDTILVQVITTMEQLIIVKTSLKNSLLGWSPASTNAELSGFVSEGGAVMAINNGRVHWNHQFGITFPTM